MFSGSEEGSYLRFIDFVYHPTLGLRVIKKHKKRIKPNPTGDGALAGYEPPLALLQVASLTPSTLDPGSLTSTFLELNQIEPQEDGWDVAGAEQLYLRLSASLG